MKKYRQFFLLLLFALICCPKISAQAEIGESPSDTTMKILPKQEVLARVDQLKALLDEKYWPGFNDPLYALEMNYYEEGPFRMQLVVNDKRGVPKMECSSPEITFQTIGINSYEEWYAMLIHECFHGFQYRKYPEYWNKMLDSNPEDFYASDSLKAIRQNYSWYSDMLDEENTLLLKMYQSNKISEVRRLFRKFLPIRESRLQMVKDKMGLDISFFYPVTETNEGTARYIEYCLYKEQGLTDTDWMFSFGGSYYYASGFYMLLIMDKFGIPYKDELFSKYFTLTDMLSDKLGNFRHLRK